MAKRNSVIDNSNTISVINEGDRPTFSCAFE